MGLTMTLEDLHCFVPIDWYVWSCDYVEPIMVGQKVLPWRILGTWVKQEPYECF